MIDVKRLGHATFSTADLPRQLAYWVDVIGLDEIGCSGGDVFLATKGGHEAVALTAGEPGKLARLSFQVSPKLDVADIEKGLAAHGVKSERRSDISPGVSKAVVFTDPKGTLVEIFADYTFAPPNASRAGVMPQKFGHIAYRVNDPQKLVGFYCDVLGFRVSDWMGDHFAFLRCGPDHHTVNFARFEVEALHHIAFEVKDVGALHASCDLLQSNDIELVWGPIRHLVGHNVAAYHRNPDDIRVELFCEMDVMLSEDLGYFEPRPWHQDRPQRPKVWPKETLRSNWGFGSYGKFPGYNDR
jgi:catechol 2,3-dioxygenase-like lactoylglutathione lyase family enzyme